MSSIPSTTTHPSTDGVAHGSRTWDSNLKGMSSLLQDHFLGMYRMTLGNITCTEMVRPLSESGLTRVSKSIHEKGWLEQFAPSIVIQGDCLGDLNQLTAETALTIQGRVLDGNHRITVLKREFDPERAFMMRVYMEFNQAEERLIANAFNDATESVVERTLYDKIYFQHELQESIKRQTKKKEVSIVEICTMYKKVGVTPPSKSTLRNWRKGVNSLKPESFEVLKEVCESKAPQVDRYAVTLNYLSRDEFAGFTSLKQGLCIHLLARYKSFNRRVPTARDYKEIESDAHMSQTLVSRTRQIVPKKKWTPELQREMNKLAYEKGNMHDIWVKPHHEERKREVAELLEKVSFGNQQAGPVRQLRANIAAVVGMKPMQRVRAIIEKDSTLRAYLTTWDGKYQDVLNRVNLHQVHSGRGGDGGGADVESNNGSASDGREKGDEGDCKHRGGDGNEGGDEHKGGDRLLDREDTGEGSGLMGKEAVGWGRGKGKGKGKHNARSAGGSPTRQSLLRPPSPSKTGDMEKCMTENTALHDLRPLDPTIPLDSLKEFTFRYAPKLAIVSIAAEPMLLNDKEATNEHLRQVVKCLQMKLHPQGTIVLFVPQPWAVHIHRLHGALMASKAALVVEDNPFLIMYKTRGGGRPLAGTDNHLRCCQDMILLAHNSGTEFTCNKRVTVDHIFGHGHRAYPPVLQTMCDVEYQGAATDIPMRALHFLVNRYTNAGDTIVSFSAERHNVVEVALERSRRVEVFVSNAAFKDEVKEKMKTSFAQAYKDGKWKVSTSLVQERVIGPSCLPEALGQTLVPIQIHRCFAEAVNPQGKAMGHDEATVFIAKTMATDFGYQIEPRASSSSNPAEMALFPLEGKDYKISANDLPAWGDLVVCNSRSEALCSICLEDQEKQCIRLLHVANNRQLKRMLSSGMEVCGPHAELYLRVAATCPLYYMRWTEKGDDANIVFTSNIPQSGSRDQLLLPFSQVGPGEMFVTPVVGSVYKPRAKDDTRSPFYVLPGVTVVRSRGFEVMDSDSDLTPMTTRKRRCPSSRTGGKGKGREVWRGAGDSAMEGKPEYVSDTEEDEEEEEDDEVYDREEGEQDDEQE